MVSSRAQRRARILLSDRPVVHGQPAPARLVTMRMRSGRVIEPGDLLLAAVTGNCWRVETAREVRRRTPDPDYAYLWALGLTRFDPDVLARHLDVTDPPGDTPIRVQGQTYMVRPAGPWSADLPGGKVPMHLFWRSNQRR